MSIFQEPVFEKTVVHQFHTAVATGNITAAKKLMQANPGLIHLRNHGEHQWFPEGRGWMHLAAQNGQAEMVRWLSTKRLSVNVKDDRGQCPLSFAIFEARSYVTARTLLDLGADSNSSFNGSTMVADIASMRDYRDMPSTSFLPFLQLLLQRGASPKKSNNFGMPPLYLAIGMGKRDVALMLLEHGAGTCFHIPDGTGEGKTIDAFEAAEQCGFPALAVEMRAWLQARQAQLAIQEVGTLMAPSELRPLA